MRGWEREGGWDLGLHLNYPTGFFWGEGGRWRRLREGACWEEWEEAAEGVGARGGGVWIGWLPCGADSESYQGEWMLRNSGPPHSHRPGPARVQDPAHPLLSFVCFEVFTLCLHRCLWSSSPNVSVHIRHYINSWGLQGPRSAEGLRTENADANWWRSRSTQEELPLPHGQSYTEFI